LDAEFLLELGRQTGGTGVVVSGGAVLDSDVRGHKLLLSRLHYRAGGTGQAEERAGRRVSLLGLSTSPLQERNEIEGWAVAKL
jgi:hypothetical protein